MGRVMGEPGFCRRGRIWRTVGGAGAAVGSGARVILAVDGAVALGVLRVLLNLRRGWSRVVVTMYT